MKLKTIHHSDGSCEILRKLSARLAGTMPGRRPDALRVKHCVAGGHLNTALRAGDDGPSMQEPAGPMRQGNGGRIVGYSTLNADAPPDQCYGDVYPPRFLLEGIRRAPRRV